MPVSEPHTSPWNALRRCAASEPVCVSVCLRFASGLLAARMLGVADARLRVKMQEFMRRQEAEVLEKCEKLEECGWQKYGL